MQQRYYVVYFRGCPIGSDTIRSLAEAIIDRHREAQPYNDKPCVSDYRIVEEVH